MKLQNKQIGIMIALVIGLFMLILPDPRNSKFVFNPELLAKTIMNGEDHISARALSEKIISGDADYQLIDIRSPEEYGKGTIKSAVNIPLGTLLQKKSIQQYLSDDKLIILFSNGDSHAQQAWIILKSAGKDPYVLTGGYNAWNEQVLNPKAPVSYADDEILRYERDKAVSGYFGGASSTQKNVKQAPAQPVFKPKEGRKKKKLEGC